MVKLIIGLTVLALVIAVLYIIDTFVYCLYGCASMNQPNCMTNCVPPPAPRGKPGEPVTILDQQNFDEYRRKLKKTI